MKSQCGETLGTIFINPKLARGVVEIVALAKIFSVSCWHNYGGKLESIYRSLMIASHEIRHNQEKLTKLFWYRIQILMVRDNIVT